MGAAILGKHHQRAWHSAADEPFHPGGGSLWSYKERLCFPQIPNHRKEECPGGAVFPGIGVQPQEVVDEAGKKKAGNPLFREKSCLTGSAHQISNRRL